MDSVLTEDFAQRLSRELIGLLLDKLGAGVTEREWSSIFARCVGADLLMSGGTWDVSRRDGVAWWTSVLKSVQPHRARHIDLNFDGFAIDTTGVEDPARLGEMVLDDWNSRIAAAHTKFSSTRVVVMLRGDDLGAVTVFEHELQEFRKDDFEWDWNQWGNVEGYVKGTNDKKFTWQPHGSQFTITTNVPDNRLKLRIRRPSAFDRDEVLAQLKFDPSWIEIVK